MSLDRFGITPGFRRATRPALKPGNRKFNLSIWGVSLSSAFQGDAFRPKTRAIAEGFACLRFDVQKISQLFQIATSATGTKTGTDRVKHGPDPWPGGIDKRDLPGARRDQSDVNVVNFGKNREHPNSFQPHQLEPRSAAVLPVAGSLTAAGTMGRSAAPGSPGASCGRFLALEPRLRPSLRRLLVAMGAGVVSGPSTDSRVFIVRLRFLRSQVVPIVPTGLSTPLSLFTGGGLEKGLANLLRGKSITKKTHAGSGQETKWEIPAKITVGG